LHKILLTCPPMIGMVDAFSEDFENSNFNVTVPEFTQEMSEDALCDIIGDYDGWIIGDDPASRRVLEAGVKGRLKACMRWGVGTNNVDFAAFKEFNIPIENTPGVFGREVADLACHYVTGLARDTFTIDRKVKQGEWFKPIGQSLWATKALIVGMGDIGKNLAKRLAAHDAEIQYYDPYVAEENIPVAARKVTWPEALSEIDVVIFTAPLNEETYHMFNTDALNAIKKPINLVNVGRGPLIDEAILIEGLSLGKIKTAALDVFEVEPFHTSVHSKLLNFSDRIIVSSHNGSNTREAVAFVSRMCIQKLHEFLSK
jgi:D-3-phosphoglycerate dehydrogenase / 2-oxoglutarate reductase